MAQYGSYKYESRESRALSTITTESYDRDQQKNLIKLNQDVSYMAAYMRKMQKGIDEANENFLEQIQSFINNLIVLFGGGDTQGFDFGDLKYIFQAIGALFGFSTPTRTPSSVTNYFSTNYLADSPDFSDVVFDQAEAWGGSIGIDASYVPNQNNILSGIWSGIVNSIQGWSDAYDQAAANATLKEQAETIAALSSLVQGLIRNESNQNVGGHYAFVNFSGLADDAALPGFGAIMYTGSGTGTWKIRNGALSWVGVPDNPRWAIAPFTDVQFKTDYQFIGATFRTAPRWFNSVAADENYFIIRSNSSYTTYTYVKFKKYSVEIGCVVSGVRTVFFIEEDFTFKSTAAYGVYAGAIGNLRFLQVIENGKPIVTYTELGTTSQIGPTYNYGAIGVMGYATVAGSGKPGEVIAFAMSDNQPPSVLGSTITINRTTTGNVNIFSGVNALPGSFFNNLGVNSEDWDYDFATGKLISLRGGQVGVSGGLLINGTTHPEKLQMYVIKNGDTVNALPISSTVTRGVNTVGGNISPEAICGCGSIDTQPGDYLQLGVKSSADYIGVFTGEATGKRSFFTASLQSRNLG